MSSSSSMILQENSPSSEVRIASNLALKGRANVRKGRLKLQGLLDLVRAKERILALFDEAGALVVLKKPDEGRCVRPPVRGETFKILEDRGPARRGEDCHGVFGVFVESRVEDAHILKIDVTFDLEEIPAQIAQLQRGQQIRRPGDAIGEIFPIRVEVLLAARYDLRDDREAVTCRCLWINRPVPTLW